MEDFKLENVKKCLENYEGKIRKERNHGSEPLQEPLTLRFYLLQVLLTVHQREETHTETVQ